VTGSVSTSSVQPAHRIPGEAGTWVFLFGDMLVFGAFFVTFLVERAKAP
jgi:nitric oxide reductase NorE protein